MERLIEKVLFNKDQVESILSLVEKFTPSNVVFKDNSNYISNSHRQSLQYSFKDNSLIKQIILPNLSSLGILDIGNETIILKYSTGHYFKKHRDREDKNGKRIKTLIIQLSDESNYSGADLIVNGKVASKQLGNVILFDSGNMHEVTKLVAGERLVLVVWLEKKDLLFKKSLV